MFVSDIRPSEEIYRYNSIKLNVLRRDMIEADRRISKGEVTKAMSDMTKDFVLMQYQQFIGGSSSANSSEVTFRTGKNFAL